MTNEMSGIKTMFNRIKREKADPAKIKQLRLQPGDRVYSPFFKAWLEIVKIKSDGYFYFVHPKSERVLLSKSIITKFNQFERI